MNKPVASSARGQPPPSPGRPSADTPSPTATRLGDHAGKRLFEEILADEGHQVDYLGTQLALMDRLAEQLCPAGRVEHTAASRRRTPPGRGRGCTRAVDRPEQGRPERQPGSVRVLVTAGVEGVHPSTSGSRGPPGTTLEEPIDELSILPLPPRARGDHRGAEHARRAD